MTAADHVTADRAATAFTDRMGRRPDGVWLAPGRVNLIGEHTDYNRGLALPFAIGQSTAAAVARRDDDTVRLATTLPGHDTVVARLPEVAPGAVSGWAAYALGVLWALREAGDDLPGLDIVLDSSVPAGAGLSSSAALECAVAVAVNDLAGLGRECVDLARRAQEAENAVVGAPTWIMDQLASLLGRRDHAVFLDFLEPAARLEPLPLGEAGMIVLVIDTHVRHANADGGYAQVRADCELAAEVAGVPSLRDLRLDDVEELTGLLEGRVFRRVRHVLTENERVRQAVRILAGDGTAGERLERVGSILDAGHESLRDDLEVSTPELDLAVSAARDAGAVGARMTGGGFGGSVVALVRQDAAATVRDGVREAFRRAGLREPAVFAVAPSDGARRVS